MSELLLTSVPVEARRRQRQIILKSELQALVTSPTVRILAVKH